MFIELKNFTKEYKCKEKKVIFKNSNLKVCRGDFVSIVGKSGSGKTTLLNIIGTLDSLSTGEYYLDGKQINQLNNIQISKIRREYIGFVFQSYHLINEFTVKDNIGMPMGYAGKKRKEREQRIKDLLIEFDLIDKIDCYPNQLSGGEKQRVAIARAISNHPKIILADEPTGNLDPKNTEIVMEILSKINSMGTTIIMVTHDMSLVKYTNKTLIVEDGSIIEKK